VTDHHPTGPGVLSPATYPTTGLPRYAPQQSSPQAIRQWLASVSTSPKQALQEWTGPGATLLPLGRRFSAVHIPGSLVAAEDDDFDTARELLAVLDGPVIRDRLAVGGSYYALVPRGRGDTWPFRDEAPYRDDGVWLGVPDIARTEHPGSFWLIPPRYEGDLCGLDLVGALVLQAVEGAVEEDGQ